MLAVTEEKIVLNESDRMKWDSLLEQYSWVFKTGDVMPMKARPLLIKVREDGVVPRLETKTRRYPINIEDLCVDDLKALVQQKIIEPVSEPSSW